AGFLQLLLDGTGNQPPAGSHHARRLRLDVGRRAPARGVAAHGGLHRGLLPHPRSPPGARPVSLMRPRLVLIGTRGTIAAAAGRPTTWPAATGPPPGAVGGRPPSTATWATLTWMGWW